MKRSMKDRIAIDNYKFAHMRIVSEVKLVGHSCFVIKIQETTAPPNDHELGLSSFFLLPKTATQALRRTTRQSNQSSNKAAVKTHNHGPKAAKTMAVAKRPKPTRAIPWSYLLRSPATSRIPKPITAKTAAITIRIVVRTCHNSGAALIQTCGNANISNGNILFPPFRLF